MFTPNWRILYLEEQQLCIYSKCCVFVIVDELNYTLGCQKKLGHWTKKSCFEKGEKALNHKVLFINCNYYEIQVLELFPLFFLCQIIFFAHAHFRAKNSLQTSNSLDFNFLWMNNQFMYELFIQGSFYWKNWKKFYFSEGINFKRQPLICFFWTFQG